MSDEAPESGKLKWRGQPFAWSLLGIFALAFAATHAFMGEGANHGIAAAHAYIGAATGVCGYLAIAGVKAADPDGRIPVMTNLLLLLLSCVYLVVKAEDFELFAQFIGFVSTLGLTIAKVKAGESD